MDLVALRYAARLNSMTALAITKLDVLAGLDTIRVCTGYTSAEGAELDHFPFHQTVLHHVTGRYEDFPGFGEDITGARSEDDLPETAREYLRFMSRSSSAFRSRLIGVGPGRDQVIWTEASRGMAISDVVA